MTVFFDLSKPKVKTIYIGEVCALRAQLDVEGMVQTINFAIL